MTSRKLKLLFRRLGLCSSASKQTWMQGVARSSPYICARCLRRSSRARVAGYASTVRHQSTSPSPPKPGQDGEPPARPKGREEGALSRRLAQMSEESLETGGRGARKAVEEAGFSDELKAKLEEKIASASFRSEHANAFAQANMPASAGKGTRDIAAAEPWTGTESVEDASLRMLTDAHKLLRTGRPPRTPGVRTPSKIDAGRPAGKAVTDARLANARDKTSIYSFMKDENLSDKDRAKFRKELKERFQPGARAVPATITGLASLANERIEDAIARGQFKNIPRGKAIERDHTASNPFLDTTEYFMNKMIQKQEIVPPWIEKQQELVATATRFRSRLRADWRRHVARTIASRGGSLQTQMRLAEEYAFAEELENPRKTKVEQLSTVDADGHVSQITHAKELNPTEASKGGRQASEVRVMAETVNDVSTLGPSAEQVTVSAEQTEGSSPAARSEIPALSRRSTVAPFRDPQWEQTEHSYHKVAIDNLNTLTRSYNLMCPDLAKKPYFFLERELRSCFADVAPQVANAIKERALAPKIKGVEVIGHKPGGVMEKFAMDKARHVYDERKPQYGFKQFWRDMFSRST